MTKELYEKYLHEINTINKKNKAWINNSDSWLADYIIEISQYIYALRKLCTPVYTILLSQKSPWNLTNLIFEIHIRYNYYGFTVSAYKFVIKLISDVFNIPIDVSLDSIGDNFNESLFMYEEDEKEEDTDIKRLKYYRNRLLDFSRSNQLVNFRKYERSCIEISYPNNSILINSLINGDRIYLEYWESLGVNQILECSSCGRQFIRKFNANSMNIAIECPNCDLNKKTKHGKPIFEKPIILDKVKQTIKCDCCFNEVVINAEIDKPIVCNICKETVKIPSYPIIKLDKTKSKLKNYCICSSNDISSQKAANLLSRRSKNLETNFGLHTLYVACGFLKWKSRNNQEYNSPLLLLKINLILDRAKGKFYFYLDQTDDEPITLNHTLDKMLNNYSNEISIVLPNFSEGKTYENYLLELKIKLKEYTFTKDWEIEDNSFIGIFHYQKLQLEKDLTDNFNKYLNHPVIRTLIGLEDEIYIESFDTTTDNCSVLDADSSQECVIEASRRGESFILQGPPGTGKSQTISNIIANAMYDGKTILFVTEKTTARNIIWDNLNQCSISGNYKLTDFIYNTNFISSKKSEKPSKEGIKKFFNEKAKLKYNSFINHSKEKSLSLIEEQIIGLYKELNKKYDGYTLRELLDLWSKFTDSPNIIFARNGESLLKDKQMNEIDNLIKEFYNLSSPFGINYKKHELYGYSETNLLASSFSKIVELNKFLKELIKLYHLGTSKYNLYFPNNYIKWNEISEKILKWLSFPKVIHEWIYNGKIKDVSNVENLLERIKTMSSYAIERKNKYDQLINNSLYPYEDLVTDSFYRNHFNALEYLQLQRYKFFLSRLSKRYKNIKKLVFLSWKSDKKRMSYKNCEKIYWKLVEIKNLVKSKTEYESFFVQDKNTFFELSDGWNTNWDDIIHQLDLVKEIISFDKNLINNQNIYSYIIKQYSMDSQVLKTFKEYALNLLNSCNEVNQKIKNLNNVFDKDVINISKISIDKFSSYLDIIYNNQNKITGWIRLQSFLNKLKNNGNYLEIIDILINNKVYNVKDAESIIRKAYYKEKILDIIGTKTNYLKFFTTDGHEQLINNYKSADVYNLTKNAEKLYQELSFRKEDKLYNRSSNNLIKNIKGISIKQIIKDNWEYIKNITPCFMMSPLNVSQYLDIDLDFDMVIFDEASQIFFEDAMASIVRGKQIIISGDRQQLPPCNFFKASDLSEDEFEYDEDTEILGHSILDASVQSDLNEVSLQWHYRSNDESLIYFSNNKFYNNSLITFPSAKRDKDLRLIYHPISNGIYGRGKQHINIQEADEVVKLIWEEIHSEKRKNFTIGVVAFNVAQAYEIEDRWLKFIASDDRKKEEFEKWESLEVHKKDPIIFCNLDTIQGDERDTMIISTTYGYNQEGKFSLKYLGPVRQNDGKKRINVAVTRAKQRMIVVTSMTSNMLKQELVKSEGLHNEGAEVLCDFLDYAEKNKNHVDYTKPTNSSEFIKSICRELDKNNIFYDLEVGLSTCKIDIAIKKGPRSNEYILGIITDDNGLSNKSVREYARLYDQVLTNKYSWELYHVWLISWCLNFESERDKLIKNIKKKLNNKSSFILSQFFPRKSVKK